MPEENPQVFIKVIPGGGTNTVDGLLGQLKYVTQERDIMEFNADGQLEFRGKENPTLFLKRLMEDDVEVSVEGFRELATKWVDETAVPPGTRDLTTHLVASFPEDTDRQAAKQAALEWAEEVFRSGKAGDIYNYAYAVHRDKGHLHVHFIINRRGLNGRWLKISNSSEGLHYDFLRQEMVRPALNNGIVLDATSREERGIIERPITTAEYYRRATGRVKVIDKVAGVIAEGPLTPPPSRSNTPISSRATPATSPAAPPSGQTPPSGTNFSPPQSQSSSRKRKRSPETENLPQPSAIFDEARRRDMSEERHLYGPQTETESSSPSSSFSSSWSSPSPAPQNSSTGPNAVPSIIGHKRKRSPEIATPVETSQDARRRDMSEERHLYGAQTHTETSSSSSPSPSPSPSSVPDRPSADASTKRNADTAGLDTLGAPPAKRALVIEEAKRKSEAAGLDSATAPSPKRPRTDEPNRDQAIIQENTPPLHNENPVGSGARGVSYEPQRPAEPAVAPDLPAQIPNNDPNSHRRQSSSQTPATAANADTNQGTGSATPSGDGPAVENTASNDAELKRRRRRKQHHIERKLHETNRTHMMETRALKKAKQQELDQQKRKLRSGNKYDPIPDRSRKKDDGHSV